MKRWEKHQTRIANAKSAREFIISFLTMKEKLEIDCYTQRLLGKCNSGKPKICEECIMEWLNTEVKEGE